MISCESVLDNSEKKVYPIKDFRTLKRNGLKHNALKRNALKRRKLN